MDTTTITQTIIARQILTVADAYNDTEQDHQDQEHTRQAHEHAAYAELELDRLMSLARFPAADIDHALTQLRNPDTRTVWADNARQLAGGALVGA